MAIKTLNFKLFSPFFIGMAKGLMLIHKAIKLGCEQVDLVLNGCKSVGVLNLDIP